MRVAWLFAIAAVPGLADSLGVLPFWNSGANPQSNLDWIGESVAESIRDAVGSRGVVAIEREDTQDAFHRLGLREHTAISEGSILKLGEELDAEQIVYGTFEFTPSAGTGTGAHGSLKIAAKILDLKRLKLSPEFVETGAVEDLATLQAHLAWRALAIVAPKLAPPESEFRSVRSAVRLDAEESYMRGLMLRDPQQKETLFLQAARLDPRFGHPCYQLGRIHYQRKEYRQAAAWLAKVGPEDFHYREAEFLLGLSLYQADDFGGAQKAFQAIVATVPLNEVFNDLGAAEDRKNLPQAVEDFRKAADGDPSDADYQFNLGYALFKRGDFAGAAEHFRAVMTLKPDDSIAGLLAARCAKKQGLTPSVDMRLTTLDRLKTDYPERAYWQLKNMLGPKAP